MNKAIISACYFCGGKWGECECKNMTVSEDNGFTFNSTSIIDPRVDESGICFVDPHLYYGDAYKNSKMFTYWESKKITRKLTDETKQELNNVLFMRLKEGMFGDQCERDMILSGINFKGLDNMTDLELFAEFETIADTANEDDMNLLSKAEKELNPYGRDYDNESVELKQRQLNTKLTLDLLPENIRKYLKE